MYKSEAVISTVYKEIRNSFGCVVQKFPDLLIRFQRSRLRLKIFKNVMIERMVTKPLVFRTTHDLMLQKI